MAKITIRENPAARRVQDDLSGFLEFCREYGYRFDESHLYEMKSHAWRQFSKFMSGKPVKNQWDEDLRRFA